MVTELTKEQKLNVLKVALLRIEGGVDYYICPSIAFAASGLGLITIPEIIKLRASGVASAMFPELVKYRPSKHDGKGAWWLVGAQQRFLRILVLKSLIRNINKNEEDGNN